ncbi:unnamed protein product [Cylindrotheca closterium]|uniref:Nudix hydrolase domain-containing protein n=1 Tax=Cylindrotheca closterium TaxID=2856 RepID=A0AAD2CVX4_9STRA|nr:unnamed protein product [Cylindrotheca closterium]
MAPIRNNRFQQKPQRKIPLHWIVMVLLFGLYFLKEAAFSDFESSSISVLSSIISGILTGPNKESLKVWDWKRPDLGNVKQHMEFVRTASEIVPRNKYYPIQHVHRNGLLHSGMVVAVLDSNVANIDAKILLLKRAPQLVTCPNAWGLVGEHTFQDETPRDTVIRGMKEELGDAFYQQFVQKGSKTMELVKLPVYVDVDYSDNGSLIDRQMTHLHVIEMNTPLEELKKLLELDDEVAETTWMTRQEIQEGWMNFNPAEKFCSNELAVLLQLVLHRLDDFEREANADKYEAEMHAAAKRKAANKAAAKKAAAEAAAAEAAAAEAAAAETAPAAEDEGKSEDDEDDEDSDSDDSDE